MAKDLSDYSTVDFLPAELHVSCGQVLMDRRQQLAIVAKRDAAQVQLVRIHAGMLRLTTHTAQQLVDEWSVAELPCEEALLSLQSLGKQLGATQAAEQALERLAKCGREPQQKQLFA